GDVIKGLSASVQTSNRRRLPVDERLHTQAHAIDATDSQRLDHLVGQGRRRALDRDFRIKCKVKIFAYGREDPAELFRWEGTGSSSTKIDGVGRALENGVHLYGVELCSCDVRADAVHIPRHLVAGKHTGGKVAKTAFRSAERNRDIEADGHRDLS